MKLLIAAAAFAVAAPVAVQAAPAQPAPAQPAPTQSAGQHHHMQGMDHSQHGEHQSHDMKDGCCADKDGNGKMDCCEKKEGQPQAAPKAPPRN